MVANAFILHQSSNGNQWHCRWAQCGGRSQLSWRNQMWCHQSWCVGRQWSLPEDNRDQAYTNKNFPLTWFIMRKTGKILDKTDITQSIRCITNTRKDVQIGHKVFDSMLADPHGHDFDIRFDTIWCLCTIHVLNFPTIRWISIMSSIG